ncbi:hypothetical protein [Crossiella sp. NPDC003009]
MSTEKLVEPAPNPAAVDLVCLDAGERVRTMQFVPNDNGCVLVLPPGGSASLNASVMANLATLLVTHGNAITPSIPTQHQVGVWS